MVEGTAQRLDELQRLSEAAAPEPWHSYFNVHGDPFVVTDKARPTFSAIATVSRLPDDYGRADARFIAAAREAVPWLIGLVRGQADALQAATDERDEALGAQNAAESICLGWMERYQGMLDAGRELEAALQRVRDVHHGMTIALAECRRRDLSGFAVDAVREVYDALVAALGVGVPTEQAAEADHFDFAELRRSSPGPVTPEDPKEAQRCD